MRDYDDEPWCLEFDAHQDAHRFCTVHQAAWCRICDEGICPQCIHDPHCRSCHAALEYEEHEWDCPHAVEAQERER